MKRETKGRAGFTLVEVLVAAGIIAVMCSVAALNIFRRTPSYRMDLACSQLIADLRSARQSAVTRSAPSYVTLNASAKSYTIWVDGNRNGTVDTGEQTSKTLPNLPPMTMAVSPASGSFSAMGTWNCSTSVEQITLTLSPVGSRIVFITPSGEVGCDS